MVYGSKESWDVDVRSCFCVLLDCTIYCRVRLSCLGSPPSILKQYVRKCPKTSHASNFSRFSIWRYTLLSSVKTLHSSCKPSSFFTSFIFYILFSEWLILPWLHINILEYFSLGSTKRGRYSLAQEVLYVLGKTVPIFAFLYWGNCAVTWLSPSVCDLR